MHMLLFESTDTKYFCQIFIKISNAYCQFLYVFWLVLDSSDRQRACPVAHFA